MTERTRGTEETRDNGQPEKSSSTPNRRQLLATTALGVAGALAGEKPAEAKRKYERGTAVKRLVSDMTPLKQRAMNDYNTSMAAWGGRLSNAGCEIRNLGRQDHYFDIVIIGSGYGGAITAARLAQQMRPGTKLAVLERGREWLPGTFPDTFDRGAVEFRNGTIPVLQQKKPHNQLGLYDMVYNKDVNVLVGNSLGGTSTINSNVAIMPDVETFMSTRWPSALRDRNVLRPYYQRAAYELNLQQIEQDTHKAIAFRNLANKLHQNCGNVAFEKANVAVTYCGRGLDQYSRNRQGVIQRPCTLCADCSAGCNIGAKNTLQMNYLPLAKRFGANLYTHTEVQTVTPVAGGYRVHFKHFKACGDEKHASCGSIRARIVIVSAGSLGSTGILLRSREAGLSVSDTLGCGFSGNGDTVGVITKSECRTNTAGYGAYETSQDPVGVTQERNLFINPEAELKYRMLIQEGAATRAYSSLLGTMLADPNLDHSLFLLAVGHDEAAGRIFLKNGRPRVSWPKITKTPYYEYALAKLKEVARVGGRKLRQFNALSLGKPTTVHPLGGCRMADDPTCGVTTNYGQVYVNPNHGDWATPMIHPGLYVADGSLVPTSLGANPLFTISALSERIAEGIVNDPAHVDLFGKAA